MQLICSTSHSFKAIRELYNAYLYMYILEVLYRYIVGCYTI